MLSLSSTTAEQPGRIASVRNALCGLLISAAGWTRSMSSTGRAECDEHADASGLIAFIRSVVLNVEAARCAGARCRGGRHASELLDAREAAPPSAKRLAAEAPGGRGVRVLKVGQEKVDRLMDLIGEMVVAKNALPYLAGRAEAHYGSRELSRENQGAICDHQPHRRGDAGRHHAGAHVAGRRDLSALPPSARRGAAARQIGPADHRRRGDRSRQDIVESLADR
ncbi:hypothetical protein [Methylosinus trichosporium]|uniref:hypothetical protein n=1 Tax=Methylosinus trichosporium TaxID=426 RepID=UPI0026BEE614